MSRSVALPAPSSGIMSQSIARLPLKHGLAARARPRRKFRLLDVVSNLSRLSFLAERPHSEQCRKPESLVCHFVSFGQMHNVRLLQKRQSIVQSNSSVATQRMRIACQPALAVPFDFMGRPAIYPDCRAIVIGRKFVCPKQRIGDLRRPTHRHDDVLRRAFPFGVLAVIQRRGEFGRNDTNQSVSSTD